MKARETSRLATDPTTIKLVTKGRATALPHVVVTRFVTLDHSFFVFAGRARSDWVLNSLAAGSARVRLGELVYETSVSKAGTEDVSEAFQLFARKYGRGLTERWYSKSEICIKLTPVSPPTTRGAVRGESEAKTTLGEWKSRGEDYYLGVSRAFDSASEEYDFTIGRNFINSWIRDRSIEELLSLTRRDDVLLEIGCGTGTEAIEISRHVAGVVATDISLGMISLLRLKIAARGLGGLIRTAQLGAAEISDAAKYLPGGKARVAYSFNGALNCEPRIAEVPGRLASVVPEGGYFVCSIRNSLCMTEAVVHAAALQFDRMAPRKKQPIMVSVGGTDIPSYYYSPKRFAKLFTPWFRVTKIIGLPAILPPAYLSDIYFRARRVLSFAERAEVAMASTFPFNRFGDQTLLVFRRGPDADAEGKFAIPGASHRAD